MSDRPQLTDTVEFAENPEPRCPCVILLDTSNSIVRPEPPFPSTRVGAVQAWIERLGPGGRGDHQHTFRGNRVAAGMGQFTLRRLPGNGGAVIESASIDIVVTDG